jgi:hypothetical protein
MHSVAGGENVKAMDTSYSIKAILRSRQHNN